MLFERFSREEVATAQLPFASDKCGALRYLVRFVQFKKRKKHPWRSVNFSKVAG